MLNKLRNVLFYSALAATSAVSGTAYADESAPPASAAAVVASPAEGNAVESTVVVVPEMAPTPAPELAPQTLVPVEQPAVIDSLIKVTREIKEVNKGVKEMSESIDGIKTVIVARDNDYQALANDVDALKGDKGSEVLGIVKEALTYDLNRVRGLKSGADEQCAAAVTAYSTAIGRRTDLIEKALAAAKAEQTKIMNDKTLSTGAQALKLREVYTSALATDGDKDVFGVDAKCLDASAKYESAATELRIRIARNLTRRGAFALEASVGYQRFGFNQGGELPRGANVGTATVSPCYDAPGIVEVCGDVGFVFAGKARATTHLPEGLSTQAAGTEYQNRTSVTGTRVTETTPAYAAGLRVMSPDLATRSELDVRVGVSLQGVLGEESVRTDRTRTSQLQDASGVAVGVSHVVSDSDVQTRNYGDFVPQGVFRLGTEHVYGQLRAGYSGRLNDAVLGVDAGFKLDF